MTLARTVRTAGLIAVLSFSICALGMALFYVHWRHELVAAGEGELLHTAPETLDRELRGALAAGTPETAAESVLRDRHVRFKYDAGRRVIRAEARDLKGSNPFAESGLYLWLHFDQNAALERVESRVTHRRSRAPFRVE